MWSQCGDHVITVYSHVVTVWDHVVTVYSHVVAVWDHVVTVYSHVVAVWGSCDHSVQSCGYSLGIM